jgi:hypothetical protein
MGRFSRYGRLQRDITDADLGTIRRRWLFARYLLCDRYATTPDGELRDGVLRELITEAKRRGEKLTGEEVAQRLEAGRRYPCESQARQARTAFETWDALREAGFPPYEADDGDQPHDPRSVAEKARAADKQLALGDADPDQLALFQWFPDDSFDELSTLAELRKHAEDLSNWSKRQADRAEERLAYVDELSRAVEGDESKTWEEADAKLRGRGA